MYSRRDFGKTMLASVPAAVLYRATPEAAAIDRQTEAVLRLLQGRAEVLGRAADGGRLGEVVLGRRRRHGPFQAGDVPGVRPGGGASPKRPEEVGEGQHVGDAEDAGAAGGEDVQDLELGRVDVVAPGHAEVAEQELRKNVRLKPTKISTAATRPQASG